MVGVVVLVWVVEVVRVVGQVHPFTFTVKRHFHPQLPKSVMANIYRRRRIITQRGTKITGTPTSPPLQPIQINKFVCMKQ